MIISLDMEEMETKIYEIGFNLVPHLAEDKIAAEVADIKAIIEKNKGTVIYEEAPKLRPLAYDIATTTAGVKRTHSQAYFGFIKFETTGSDVMEVKIALDKKDTIIRYLLIKTIKDNTMYGTKMARTDGPRPKKGKEDGKDGVPSPMSQADMDKTIDELVIE